MNKLSRIAKNLDLMVKVAYKVCYVCAIIITVMAAILLFFGDTSFIEFDQVLTLGSVNFELSPEHLPAPQIIKTRIFIGLLLVVLILVLSCFTIRLVRKILAPMAEAKPFDTQVFRSLRQLSYLTLIGGAALSLIKTAGEALLLSIYDLSTIFKTDAILSISQDHVLDFSFVSVFAILYLLSYVFQYGEALQKQSDETL